MNSAARAAGRVGQHLALLVYMCFLVAPLLWVLSVSLKPRAELFDLVQSWIPRSLTFENYATVLAELPIARGISNSLLVSSLSAVGAVALGLPASYLMARQRNVTTRLISSWVLASQMFPFIIILVPLFLVTIELGLYDRREALILIYIVWSMPFAIWMLRNYLRTIPAELEQAAALDRANGAQILALIIAPLAVPGVIVAFLFAFIMAWNEFFFGLVLIKNPDISPLSLMLVRFIGNDGEVRMGPLAAASILSAIPNLVLFTFLQRRLVQGLLGGSVRG